METTAGIWEQVARQVPLDVLVLILAAVAFAAGVITYCYEVHSAPEEVPGSPNDIEDASPVSVKSSPPEKAEDTEQDRRHKAREDLPEPEPEGCDEDSRRKGLEVCLERLPGEAWGFAWHSKAFCEQRLIVVGIDPDSPAGRWQLQREHQGLPTVQRGDELVCANEVAQHSSMQISLVVANKLRLKFLRAEGVADLARGVVPKLEVKDACKEEVLKETPALPPLQPDTFAESDTDDLAETGSQNLLNYDGVPRNFWSYQRLPRPLPAETADAAPVDSQSEQRAPEKLLCEKTTVRSVPQRSRSDPPAAPRRRGGMSSPPGYDPGAVPHLFTRSRTAGSRSPVSKHSPQSALGRGPLRHRGDARDGQIVSCGSESENASRSDQCPSTDWEYMMDNRAQQCQSMPDAAQGGVVMMLALQPMLGGVLGQPGQHGPFVPAPVGSPHVSDASSTPPPLTSPKVPSMPATSSTQGAGLMVPMTMNHGFAAGSASAQNAQVMGWAPAWRSDGVPPRPEQGLQGLQASASSSWLQPQSMTAEENTAPNLAARSGKKTYRAGQRLTARRLRAAQRAAELNQALPSEPLPSPSPPSEPSSEEPPGGAEARTKPRRRAGVRVRRRREHAIARRREQEEQGDAPRPQPVGAVPPGPLPPRQEEVDGFDSPAELDQLLEGSPVSSQQWAASKRLRSQPRDYSNDPEHDVIGREVLINGLVHTPQLNGHWGRVADFDPVHRCYLVHAFVSGSSPLALRLRRDAFVVPKTNPPSPDEIVEGVWQPSLRIQ